jgi:hypothetical protein
MDFIEIIKTNQISTRRIKIILPITAVIALEQTNVKKYRAKFSKDEETDEEKKDEEEEEEEAEESINDSDEETSN